MREALLAGVAIAALIDFSGVANANIIVERSFSGSGSQGFLEPVTPSEPWSYCGASGPPTNPHACTPILTADGSATTDVGWGSPGVSSGVTPSNEAVAVTNFEITFDAPLDPDQVTQGNASGCRGLEDGGTVFCAGAAGIGGVQWTAVFDPASPDSISFFAPAGTQLNPGDPYFVNVMLLEGGDGAAFTGAWTRTGTTPEPGSLAVLGAALAGFGVFRRRRRKPG